MIKMLIKPPRKVAIAVSGGKDSMVALDFLVRGGRDVTVLHFSHGTRHSGEAREFVKVHCEKHNIPIIIGRIPKIVPPAGVSLEEYWRKCRYAWFKEAWPSDLPIVTAHHLNDAVETWLFTCMHGNPFLIPPERDNFIRPFLLTTRKEIDSWAERKKVPWIQDPSNFDSVYMRNYIRHDFMPHALHVNPGIEKVIKKKYLELQK